MKKLLIASLLSITVLTNYSCRTKINNNNQNGPDAISTFTGQMQQVWDASVQPNPKAFLDLNTGIVYDVNTAPAHADDIDLIWTNSSGGDIICSPQDYYEPNSGSPSFETAAIFASWGQRNQTIIESNPNQTVAEFNAVTNQTQLLGLMGDKFDFTNIQFAFMGCTNADFNKIYYFQTTNAGVKKKGYIQFKSGQVKNNNFATFEIKVQK